MSTTIDVSRMFTTGQAARLCHVAPRTVGKWFDSGLIGGYRIPGSQDRRIDPQSLIRFMKLHGIPLGGLQASGGRLLLAARRTEEIVLLGRLLGERAGLESHIVESAFAAGLACARLKPGIVIVDEELAGDLWEEWARGLAHTPDLPRPLLLAAMSRIPPGMEARLQSLGYEAALIKPLTLRRVLAIVAEHTPHQAE